MKLTKGMKLRTKIKYAIAKGIMIAVTGRIDLRRDEDIVELTEAFDKKLNRLGAIDQVRSDKVKELRKEWEEAFAPQRKTTVKVFMDTRCYERMCMYATAKEVCGYVENNDVDGLEAMLRRKMDELEELQQRLEDLLGEDS